MMDAKRIRFRSTNWSEQEKKVLRMLVRERAGIIEKKDTSSETNVSKRIAWNEVLSRFNAVNSKKRDMTQLLNQWRNMKNIAKKTPFASRRARSMAGGPSPASWPQEHPPAPNTLSKTIPVEVTVDRLYCYNSSDIGNIKKETVATRESPTHELSELKSEMPPPPQDAPRTSCPVYKKKKMKCSCCRESHDHQLFILAKKAREEATFREKEAHEYKMMSERELHEKRMAILSLEEKYWHSKISKLK